MLNCKNKRKTSQLCFNLKEVHPRVLVVSNRPSKVPGQLGGLNLGMQSSDRLQQNGLQFNKKNHGLLRKLFKISVLHCTFNKMDCSWIKRTLVYRYYFQLKKSRLNMDWNEIEWVFFWINDQYSYSAFTIIRDKEWEHQVLTLNWLAKEAWSRFCLIPRSFFSAWLLPLDLGFKTYRTATVPFFSN